MLLQGTGQILTRKILCWIILIKTGPTFETVLKKCQLLDAINSVLNKYAPLKKVIKHKLRLKKTCMTSGIQKSIYIKNKLLNKFINKKYP